MMDDAGKVAGGKCDTRRDLLWENFFPYIKDVTTQSSYGILEATGC